MSSGSFIGSSDSFNGSSSLIIGSSSIFDCIDGHSVLFISQYHWLKITKIYRFGFWPYFGNSKTISKNWGQAHLSCELITNNRPTILFKVVVVINVYIVIKTTYVTIWLHFYMIYMTQFQYKVPNYDCT